VGAWAICECGGRGEVKWEGASAPVIKCLPLGRDSRSVVELLARYVRTLPRCQRLARVVLVANTPET
jgi:hypothetical protein